jgi:N-acetylneuraminate lyase
MPPYYYPFTPSEIRDYYFRLADTANLPMVVYHIPALSGVNMGKGQLAEMLADERIMGLKYTANDLFMLERIREAFPDKIIYNGYDEIMLAGLSMGADGGIGSTYNFMADKFVQIRKLYQENRMEEARAIQREANRIIAVLCSMGVMQAEKEILCQLGLDFGCCRHPFGKLGEEQKQLLRREVLPYITEVQQ